MPSNMNWDTGGGEGGTPPIGRNIFAGDGLVGGGDLSQDRTISAGAGNGIVLGVDTIGVKLAATSGLNLSGGDLQLDDSVAGGGLSIGSKILSVSVGNGLEVSSDAVKVKLATTSGLEFSTGDLQIRDDIAGAGLSITNKILAVGAGTLITVDAGTVSLSVGSAQYQVPVTGATPFTPAWQTTSSAPSAAEILRADGSGGLRPAGLGIGVDAVAGKAYILGTSEQLRLAYNATNYFTITTATAGNVTLESVSSGLGGNITLLSEMDIILDPTGLDVLPGANYEINLGSLIKKYLTIHAAELWVETLVAQDTIATIGGHILVAPTTILVADVLSSQTQLCLNPGFETAGGGGVDVFADWTEAAGTGTILRESTYKHTGTYSCRLTAGSTFNTNVLQNVTTTGVEGFTISFWYRNSNGTYPGRYGLYDVTHSSWIVALTSVGSVSTTWTEVVFTALVPTSCTQVALYFYCPGTNTYYCSFDDVLWYADFIVVKHNQMVSNDIVYLQSNGKIEFMQVIGNGEVSSSYTYYVQRNLDGSGLNSWYAGDAVLNTGTTGDGYIDVYSDHSIKGATEYGPTVAGIIRTGTVYSSLIEGWAVGNLNGLYGYGADTYGAAFGEYINGKSFVTIEPTGGIQMQYRSGGVNYVNAQWAVDGVLTIGEVAASKSNVQITAGTINLRTNTTVNISLDTSGVIVVGEVGASKSNIQITAGALNFRTNTTVNMSMATTGAITVGPVAAGNVYVTSSGVALRYGSTTYINLDTSGNALFGLTGASKSNAYWNVSNSRLEFRTDTTVRSYIDTDGSFVVVAPAAYQRNNAIVFSASAVDSGGLYGYNTSGSHGIELSSPSISGHMTYITLKATSLASDTSYYPLINLTCYRTSTEVCGIQLQGLNAGSRIYVTATDIRIGVTGSTPSGHVYLTLIPTDTTQKSLEWYENTTNHLYLIVPAGSAGGRVAIGGGLYVGDTATVAENGRIYTGYVETLVAGQSEDYAASIRLAPGYTGAYTVTRHNYISMINVTVAASAVVTDAAAIFFPAAAGTHKAIDSGTTKTSPGTVSVWMKINVNGVIHYVPAYTSKTT